jgi:hypothetical protein
MEVSAVCRKDGRTYELQSVNLSEAGVLLKGSASLEHGDAVEVELQIPDGAGAANLHGRVIRRDQSDHLAVAFSALSYDSRERIRQCLQHHQRTAAPIVVT